MAPYFSIIIPCYNCENTIERLLDSIVGQELEFEELEVIIVNDNSTDNFLEKVRKYESILNIKYFDTVREIHCPGNSRQVGLDNASGKWVTFIDNDDLFEYNVFKKVKDELESKEVKYGLVCLFDEYDNENEEIVKEFNHDISATWLHGKFYNVDIIRKTGVRFKEDLVSHEDLYFNNNLNVKLREYYDYDDLNYLDLKVYRWIANPESLSRKTEKDKYSYMELYLNDYIYSGTELYFELFNKTEKHKSECVFKIIMTLLFGYFYIQGSIFQHRIEDIIFDNIKDMHNLKARIEKEIGFTSIDILNFVYSNEDMYYNIRSMSYLATNGKFIENQSLRDFLLNL